jgi:NAD(P)-dependent dehydrogenase (short-subunit alcohol dehydrogenase family)
MEGKTIIVTGGFGAIGQGVAEAAARRGARVAAVDLAAEPPKGLAERLGPDSLLIGGVDLSSFDGARKAVAEVKARFGRLDALINAAGGFRWQKIEDGDPATWDFLHTLNVKTTLNACRAALPFLAESGAGRIVNVGAHSALKAATGMGPYAASKAAVHRLTESLAEEFKDRGVTVNAVLPSIIDTPANRAEMPKANFEQWVKPADLAAVILFLASEEARAVTGALLPVTGRV